MPIEERWFIKMKKVGILTMHQVRNYGSFAQAYATCRSIDNLGYETELIDYTYPNEAHGTKKSTIGKILHWGNLLTKSLIPGMPHRKFEQNYRDAYKKYYKLSKPYYNRDAIKSDPPQYDIYVVGSDQVWNDSYIKTDDTFFLAFAPVNSKRIAFASSFGKTCLDKYNESFYREKLNSLDRIAVRETSGVKIVEDLTGRDDIKKVLDPTLLLNSDEWRRISIPFIRAKRPYIFVYGSHCRKYMLYTARNIADKKGWDVYTVNGTIVDYYNKEAHCLLDIGPREWMGLIDNAELVFSCSFHGVAFSIQFNTPFFAIFKGDEQFDSRVSSFLTELSLEKHRLLVGTTEVDLNNAYEEDWNRVNTLIDEKRNTSLEVLQDFLSS